MKVLLIFFAVGFYTFISNYLFLSYFHADSVKTTPTQEYVMEVFFTFNLFLGLFTKPPTLEYNSLRFRQTVPTQV